MMGEDGWEPDYSVIEEVPSAEDNSAKETRKEDDSPALTGIIGAPSEPVNWDWGDLQPSLRIDLDSVEVHVVERVQFETERHNVRRHRWEKRDLEF